MKCCRETHLNAADMVASIHENGSVSVLEQGTTSPFAFSCPERLSQARAMRMSTAGSFQELCNPIRQELPPDIQARTDPHADSERPGAIAHGTNATWLPGSRNEHGAGGSADARNGDETRSVIVPRQEHTRDGVTQPPEPMFLRPEIAVVFM